MLKNFFSTLGCSVLLLGILCRASPGVEVRTLERQSFGNNGAETELDVNFKLFISNDVLHGDEREKRIVDEALAQMRPIMEKIFLEIVFGNIEYETSGLITRVSDSILGADVTNASTFWGDIGEAITKIKQAFFTQTDQACACVKDFMKNSGELKYALCAAVAWAKKLNISDEMGADLYSLYEIILEETPSKEGAIALVKTNSVAWGVFPEEVLTLIEAGE